MKVHIETDTNHAITEPTVGNVYSVQGGKGSKYGHMMIIIAITESYSDCTGRKALMLVVNKDGKPVNTSSYGAHYLRDKCPIAFVDGLDDLELRMRSL